MATELGFNQCLQMPAECAVFWAGWGTIVSAAVGLVTVLVAVLAWLTSRRAAKIAKEATRIAEQQHDEAVQLRKGTARILGSLLAVEVLMLPPKLGAVIARLDLVINTEPSDVMDWSHLEWVVEELGRTFLPTTEEAQGRLHNLPDTYGDELAALVGMGRGLVDSAKRLSSRLLRTSFPNGQVFVVGYAGDASDFESMRNQVTAMLGDAIITARSFARFVHAEDPEYADEQALFAQG